MPSLECNILEICRIKLLEFSLIRDFEARQARKHYSLGNQEKAWSGKHKKCGFA